MNQPAPYTTADFEVSPFIVFYETTRACDLVCKHCRACAQPRPHPSQLTTGQSLALLKQLSEFPKKPNLVFTGGDPMKRPDIHDLVEAAVSYGLVASMTPSATPLVTEGAIRRLAKAGIGRLAMSIDGKDAETHDTFRGVGGSFDRTIEILRQSREAGIPVQVNTTITRRNVDQVDEIAELMAKLDIVLWSVFFLVPVGRGLAEERVTPEQYEQVFERIWHHARAHRFGVKTTEAHHYRRFVLQHEGDPQRQPDARGGQIQRAPLGVNDGKGVMFISHTGSVYPSGFMPILCGQFPKQSVIDIYRDSPVMQSLRNPDGFKGKCGVCEYRWVCGGSRARAYAVTRDPLAAEPDCMYIPDMWKESAACLA